MIDKTINDNKKTLEQIRMDNKDKNQKIKNIIYEDKFNSIKAPEIHKEITPIIHQRIEPVITKEIQPIVHKEIQPVIHQKIQPVIIQEIQTVIHDGLLPIMHKEIQPRINLVLPNNNQPLITKRIEPVIHKTIKPVIFKEFRNKDSSGRYNEIPSIFFIQGEILNTKEEFELLEDKINKNNSKIRLYLIYKATIDSDKASAFHKKCDEAKSTLVLIKSKNGKRFGGYTSCSWKGNSKEKKDENAFLFSLDKMKIYPIISGQDAIGCYSEYGPVFMGFQILIKDNFFKNGGTTYLKGINYDTEEDYELTGGLKEFKVEEIEVYEIFFNSRINESSDN